LFREWDELGYSDEIKERVFHSNAERVLGLSPRAQAQVRRSIPPAQ
jgi:predicted TIM-barrel fold metal-dependent hydrolase